MEKRHQDALTLRLEEVMNKGVTHVLDAELYLWYGVQRMAVRTWRDINTRWAELTEGNEEYYGKLMKIEGAGGKFLVAGNSVVPLIADEE